MRRPGHWLRRAAARVCAKQTIERVIDPTVADLQAEYEEAIQAKRWWSAGWICIGGYSAFWKAVGLHVLHASPRLVRDCIAEDGWALGRTIAYSLIAFISFTLLLTAPPLAKFYTHVQSATVVLLLVPQAVPLSMPVALPLGIVCSSNGTRVSARRIRGALLLAIVAMLVAFGAILIVPDANQAFRVALAKELGRHEITKYSLPRGTNELSLSELAKESRDFDAGGFPEKAREVNRAYQIRLALPAATFVLSLLAVVISVVLGSRPRRLVAIIVALVLYWTILALAEWNATLPAVVSVWAPNVIFAAISLALLQIFRDRTQRPLGTR